MKGRIRLTITILTPLAALAAWFFSAYVTVADKHGHAVPISAWNSYDWVLGLLLGFMGLLLIGLVAFGVTLGLAHGVQSAIAWVRGGFAEDQALALKAQEAELVSGSVSLVEQGGELSVYELMQRADRARARARQDRLCSIHHDVVVHADEACPYCADDR